jgi:hypothetical protein
MQILRRHRRARRLRKAERETPEDVAMAVRAKRPVEKGWRWIRTKAVPECDMEKISKSSAGNDLGILPRSDDFDSQIFCRGRPFPPNWRELLRTISVILLRSGGRQWFGRGLAVAFVIEISMAEAPVHQCDGSGLAALRLSGGLGEGGGQPPHLRNVWALESLHPITALRRWLHRAIAADEDATLHFGSIRRRAGKSAEPAVQMPIFQKPEGQLRNEGRAPFQCSATVRATSWHRDPSTDRGLAGDFLVLI